MKTLKLLVAVFILINLSSCSKEELNEEQNLNIPINSEVKLPTENNLTFAEELIIEINNYRTSQNLSVLSYDTGLATNLALEHSNYMINMDQASHDNFMYRSETLKSNTGANTVSENVAYGYSSAASTVNAWLNSPSHKAVLDGDFDFVGLGVLTSNTNTNFITALFYKY